MKKEATGLLSVNHTKQDERSPTQIGKNEDDVMLANFFVGRDSFVDIDNSNAQPMINDVYNDKRVTTHGVNLFEMNKLTEEDMIHKPISDRDNKKNAMVKKISSRCG
jgi:hypothetical protein